MSVRSRAGVFSNALASVTLLTGGVGLTGAFAQNALLPVQVGVVVLFLIAIWGICTPGLPQLGLLSRLMIALYALPFSVLLGYLLEPDYIWMLTPKGIEVIQDRVLIEQMITVGNIGLMGLIAGIRLSRFLPSTRQPTKPSSRSTLSPEWCIPVALAAVLLSWLSTPKETIFQAAYFTEQGATVADESGFAAAYVVSYVILLALYIDAECTASKRIRILKFGVVASAVLYIVVFLQVLRGNREASGLIVGLFGLFVTRPFVRLTPSDDEPRTPPATRLARRRFVAASLPLTILTVVFIALGELRGVATDVSNRLGARETFLLGLSQNTWTAVLWTNLGAAWMYRSGELRLRYGETYLDYLLTLPPGFVANAVGYDRPAASNNLATEDPAGVSAGGLHAVVTPFKNFGAPGALVLMMLAGLLIGWREWKGAAGTVSSRLVYATFLCASFNWFWYGDLPFIRALLGAGVVLISYRTAVRVSPLRTTLP